MPRKDLRFESDVHIIVEGREGQACMYHIEHVLLFDFQKTFNIDSTVETWIKVVSRSFANV